MLTDEELVEIRVRAFYTFPTERMLSEDRDLAARITHLSTDCLNLVSEVQELRAQARLIANGTYLVRDVGAPAAGIPRMDPDLRSAEVDWLEEAETGFEEPSKDTAGVREADEGDGEGFQSQVEPMNEGTTRIDT